MPASTFDLTDLIRPNILNLKPYRSARDDFSEGILLDANENSLGSVVESEEELNRYPSPLHDALRQKWADYRGVQKDHIFLGVGSDEPIDLLIRMTCHPGRDNILITPPTYGMYKVAADVNDVAVKEVQLDADFQPLPEEILNTVDENTKLLFLCSPNNPTGNLLDPKRIYSILEVFNGLVVIDEAYIDFSSSPGWSAEIQSYPNLVVLQTLSKAFGLAGIRIGAALSSAELIGYMLRMKAPYNINKLTANTALKAFDQKEKLNGFIKELTGERKRLEQELSQLNIVQSVRPSDANFLLVHFTDARNIYQKLAQQGVIVRYRGDQPGCDEALRITVGTREENDRLITELKRIS